MDKVFDTVIKNARVVRPNKTSVDCLDIAIKDGKIARLAPDIQAGEAKQVFDAKNRLAFPGCVDAHMHIGIYAPLAQDAISESKAAAMGGVTSSLNYIRTGHYYLNRGGPYRAFMAEVHKQAKDKFWVDYRIPHRADRIRAYRRDGASGHRSWRDVVQDLHVLRRLRAARRFVAAERISDDRAGRALRHRAFRVHHARGAAPDGEISEARSVHQRQPALRAGGNPHRLHQDRRARRQAEGASRLQRGAPAAFGRARHLDRVLSGQRDQLPEHQSAASELAQGDRRGVDDAAGLSAYRLPARGHRSAIFCSTPIANARCTPRSIRRSARGKMSRRSGRPCSTARSTGSSAITPAARPSRNGRRTIPTISGWPRSGFGGTEYLLSGVVSEGSKRGMSYNHMAELSRAGSRRSASA